MTEPKKLTSCLPNFTNFLAVLRFLLFLSLGWFCFMQVATLPSFSFGAPITNAHVSEHFQVFYPLH